MKNKTYEDIFKKTVQYFKFFQESPNLIKKKPKSCEILKKLQYPLKISKYKHTVLPRLVRMRTIKLMSFLIKKSLLFWAISWDFRHFWAEKPWFEIAMTLINHLYLPKSCQKVNRGILFLYKGFVLFWRAY